MLIPNNRGGIYSKYEGSLIYDKASDRMNVRLSTDSYYGLLHCGKTLDVRIDGKWMPTRIEYDNGWYLVGIDTDDLVGLIVRI